MRLKNFSASSAELIFHQKPIYRIYNFVNCSTEKFHVFSTLSAEQSFIFSNSISNRFKLSTLRKNLFLFLSFMQIYLDSKLAHLFPHGSTLSV